MTEDGIGNRHRHLDVEDGLSRRVNGQGGLLIPQEQLTYHLLHLVFGLGKQTDQGACPVKRTT